jgi:hypothetical protein
MIIDDALRHRDPRLSHKQQEYLLDVRRRAQAFVFTAEASRLVGRFANQCRDLVLRHRQFALPPFPETHVEYDCVAFMRDFPGMTAAENEVGFTRENMDRRVGYPISGDTVSVFACGPDDRRPDRGVLLHAGTTRSAGADGRGGDSDAGQRRRRAMVQAVLRPRPGRPQQSTTRTSGRACSANSRSTATSAANGRKGPSPP